MNIPQLAGLSVRLKDGTIVVFTDGDEGERATVTPKPRPQRPMVKHA